ncbi:Shedu immune nuclease family protein [Achromobacter sp. NCFB-sbj8-Ac1-l]|uniref:Shedu immune nuclease family protein n=1 Tax=unclassified Achromobacter TaxID=2626865 RepID=UPI004046B333
MKVSDFIFEYDVGADRSPGACRLRIFVNHCQEVYVLMTDLEDRYKGPSITNTVESLKEALILKGLVPTGANYIEHYPRELGREAATFDIVTFDSGGHPNWKHVDKKWVEEQLECSSEELEFASVQQERILRDIAQLRQRADPFSDFSYLTSPVVLSRQAQIELGMLPRRAIQELVDARVDERGLLRLLKTDLSVFGEVYADRDEYICFSEFPLGDGFVDFVVFSGRSRMDVTFIEIKGANFNLVNQTGYGKFASKVEEAADQIRDRVRTAYLDYESFRKAMHEIRCEVEAGKQLHNSFVGAHGHLEVDGNKDVNVRCVVIGGRSNDDLAESQRRHVYERTFSVPLRLDSWDSWMRKLNRP